MPGACRRTHAPGPGSPRPLRRCRRRRHILVCVVMCTDENDLVGSSCAADFGDEVAAGLSLYLICLAIYVVTAPRQLRLQYPGRLLKSTPGFPQRPGSDPGCKLFDVSPEGSHLHPVPVQRQRGMRGAPTWHPDHDEVAPGRQRHQRRPPTPARCTTGASGPRANVRPFNGRFRRPSPLPATPSFSLPPRLVLGPIIRHPVEFADQVRSRHARRADDPEQCTRCLAWPGNWVRSSCSIGRSFVLSHNIPIINAMDKLGSFGAFRSPPSPALGLTGHYAFAPHSTLPDSLPTPPDRRGQAIRNPTPPAIARHREPNCERPNGVQSRWSASFSSI